MKKLFGFIAILLIVILVACDKTEEEQVVSKYVGTWERSWFDTEKNLNLTETLTIEESTFTATINKVENDVILPYIQFNGSQNVIDNTLEASIIKIRIINENNSFTYSDQNDNNFESLVVETLKIHPNFIGTYFIDPGQLTLRLDMDGDGSVTGDEGLFVFQKK